MKKDNNDNIGKKLKIFDLFTDQKNFFCKMNEKKMIIFLLIIIWLCGVGGVIQKITMDYNSALAGKLIVEGNAYALQHWTFFWFIAGIAGLACGVLIYWLGGWWYNLRIRLSGDKNFLKKTGRKVFVVNLFLREFPMVFFAVIGTFIFKDYASACLILNKIIVLFYIFDVISVINSFRSVIILFNVNKSRAAILFLIPHLIYYMISFLSNLL